MILTGARQGGRFGSPRRAWHQSALVAGTYALLGSLWIYFSDRLVGVLSADAEAQSWMQTYKGWAFVAGSALLMFLVTRGVLEANRHLERRARQGERLFRNTFEHAAVGIAHVAPDGRFLRVNQRLCEILDRDAEELLAGDFQRFTPAEDRRTDLTQLGRVLAGETAGYTLEKRYRRRDGSLIWVLLTVALMRDADGQPDYFISVLQDIQERKRAELEVLALNAELEQRVEQRTAELSAVNQELETFSYSVSHDLKAPLRGIDGYARLLQEECGPALQGQGAELLDRVRDGVAQMNTLIEALLEYSRMERAALRLQPLALDAVVEAALADCRAEVEARGGRLQVQVPPLRVVADPDGLLLALRNLLGNAVKFCAEGGAPQVSVGAEAAGPVCRLWVRDNGIGFDMRFHEQIFEIFRRLAREGDQPGTGVGLAMVERAMQRMHGRVWARSAPGQGATFFLEIPLER